MANRAIGQPNSHPPQWRTMDLDSSILTATGRFNKTNNITRSTHE